MWRPSERTAFLSSLSRQDKERLLYHWRFWARPGQLWPAGDWRYWLILAGRGYGKTRTGAEACRKVAKEGRRGDQIGLIGQTVADVRQVMVEGPAGIMAVSPRNFQPTYEPSKRLLTWPNGVKATTFSGDRPDQLRGPAHSFVWADEPAKWKYPTACWDMMEFGLRAGRLPRVVATTTPRPIPLIKDLLKNPRAVVTRGKTYENQHNLAPDFIDAIRRRYAGTRLGRQELDAEILDDNPRALWQRGKIDELRVDAAPDLYRIVVAVDPMTADPDESPELEETSATGIVVAGCTPGRDGHGYVLEDCTIFGTPHQWGLAAVEAYQRWHASRVVCEINQGGKMVEFVIKTVAGNMGLHVPYKGVHAALGKYTRAEPVAALYEQGRVHHVGSFADLEDELCEWVPGMPSPNRLDSLVWAFTDLLVENIKRPGTWAATN